MNEDVKKFIEGIGGSVTDQKVVIPFKIDFKVKWWVINLHPDVEGNLWWDTGNGHKGFSITKVSLT